MRRSPRDAAVVEVSRVIYRRLHIHPTMAYGLARLLDRHGLVRYEKNEYDDIESRRTWLADKTSELPFEI